jgi:hypothetical protein
MAGFAPCSARFVNVTGHAIVWVLCRRPAGHLEACDPTHEGKLGRHLVRWR